MIIIYTKYKRDYLKGLSDIQEIVSSKPMKKEAKRKEIFIFFITFTETSVLIERINVSIPDIAIVPLSLLYAISKKIIEIKRNKKLPYLIPYKNIFSSNLYEPTYNTDKNASIIINIIMFQIIFFETFSFFLSSIFNLKLIIKAFPPFFKFVLYKLKK